MRYLGIDYGDKKIGLALGDDETQIASPTEVIENKGHDTFDELESLIKKESIDAVVVGMPIQETTHSREQMEKTKNFIVHLKDHLEVSVYEEDERYTTAESQRLQEEYGSEVEEDALAAMLVLQAYLDRKRT